MSTYEQNTYSLAAAAMLATAATGIRSGLKTSELERGQVVVCHGMRCLIDRDIRQRNVGAPMHIGPVIWTDALVLNRADVTDHAVPHSFTRRPNGEHRWMIQGNDLARWSVERSLT